uniref:Uncharacterized protein n=1 Tax=Melopsittacus undulatus TaxID=13146 RepID=A0A8C6NBJ9_MELUD
LQLRNSTYKCSQSAPEPALWKVLDVESQYPKELGRSLGLSNDTFSLRIKNATSQNSGTYKCTLEEQRGENSLSSIVTLKVTGCAGIEDEKLKKHKAELFMLTCLGIFYLLLIFFTCLFSCTPLHISASSSSKCRALFSLRAHQQLFWFGT